MLIRAIVCQLILYQRENIVEITNTHCVNIQRKMISILLDFKIWPDSLRFYMVCAGGSVGDNLICHAQEEPSVVCSDVHADSAAYTGDVVYLINYFLKGVSAPNPLWIGDADSNLKIDLEDLVFLIDYIFKNGNPPVC